ncbi:MAG: VCBS repeat-containing protein, partial [Planctomycetes bacterium]|nr:VCBS repeat-containing protein [Planctomycetota bacterium]
VQPFTVQMMSGADAVDFNGDGDLDIVTGQGHGGSGIRFYERDYINDYVNETVSGTNTWPSVTVGATERKLVRADFDGDNDVDQADFGHLQECFSESGMAYLQGCADADFDGDGDVDLKDFTAFITCMNGPDTASNCAWM